MVWFAGVGVFIGIVAQWTLWSLADQMKETNRLLNQIMLDARRNGLNG